MRTGMRVGVCGLLIFAANAAPAADRGFYFGASAGQSQYDFDMPDVPVFGVAPPILVGTPDPIFTPFPTVPGPVGGVIGIATPAKPLLWLPGDDDEGTSWTVTAGYRINRYLAVEAGYVNLGTLSSTHTIARPAIFGGGTFNFSRELQTEGPTLTAFGVLPLSDSWQLFARVGMLFADSDLRTSVDGSSSFASSFDSDATTLGAGAQYDWGGHWSGRLEFQRTQDLGGDDVANSADVDSISLGFLYRL